MEIILSHLGDKGRVVAFMERTADPVMSEQY